MRDQAESGRYLEGIGDDGLLGFAELGVLPAPPERKPGSEAGAAAAAAAAAEAAPPSPPAPPALYPYLANLAVKTGARRLGLGRELVVGTEEKAAELGYDRMYIKVDRENLSARRLYDRLGYKLVYMQNRMADRGRKATQFLFLRKDLLEPPPVEEDVLEQPTTSEGAGATP